jgi:hypothetical protein
MAIIGYALSEDLISPSTHTRLNHHPASAALDAPMHHKSGHRIVAKMICAMQENPGRGAARVDVSATFALAKIARKSARVSAR